MFEAGAVLVPVNTRFKGVEAADILRRSRARVLVTVTDFLGTDYVAMLDDTRRRPPRPGHHRRRPRTGAGRDRVVGRLPGPGHRRGAGRGRPARAPPLGPDDPSDILFTSGTTGVPKGVVQTHGRTLRVATDWVAMTGLTAGDRYLMVNPYFHMFGLKAGILASVAAGATMLPEAVFDVDRALARVADEAVTVLPGAPALYQAILDHPDRDRHDLSSLRVAVTGAADIPVELIRRVDEELPFSIVITGYGLTEGGTASATSPDDDVETIATTVGRPRPGFELRIVDGDGGEVAPGEPGEILLRGGSIMSHYLDDPEATAAALSADGWLRTGDLGVIDDAGCLRIVGRAKDMFIVGGFNAYPAEIENALVRHPDIQQAAVDRHPRPAPGRGRHGVRRAATRRGGRRPTTSSAWSREQMANYKVPRAVEIVDELPLERHRQGDEGDAPRAGRADGLGVGVVTARRTRRPLRVRRPPGRRARGVGGGAVDGGAAGRLGCRRHQGRAADRRSRCATCSARSASATTCRTRRSRSTTAASAAWCSTCATRTGREHMEELLATADVFISNLRPDALDKLDLEPAATVARHPASSTSASAATGSVGDDRDRPTYDIGAFWARSGLSMQMADGDGNPLNARGGIGDHITGLASLAGLLAAVIEQRHTGVGRVVEVSLLRTGTYVLGWDLGIQMALGKVAGAEPRHRNQAPLMNPYRAADGRWFFFTGLEAQRHLPAVCRALDRPDLLDDERFASASAIRRNRTEVIAILDEIIAERPLAEWAERFERRGRVVGAGADAGRGGRRSAAHRQRRLRRDRRREPAAPRCGRSTARSRSRTCAGRPQHVAVPALGEHTDEVLKEVAEWPRR